MKTAITLALMLAASPVLAQDQPDYLDDRSTPEAVISSYYDAINRSEYARAYSYLGDADQPDYDTWQAGYADTGHVDVSFGQSAQEGAAGSTYWTLPVKLDVTASDGKHSYFAGCYTLRLVQPAVQEPPFRPLHIVEGDLKTTDAKGIAPADCGP